LTDILSKEQRSERMKKIRSFDTAWEMNFRSKLWRLGLRYRTHYGAHKIDIAFPRQRVAVFLDSCFWHYCPRHRETPETNAAFWRAKLAGNRRRDRRVSVKLRREGWMVLRLWSHEFVPHPDFAIRRVRQALRARRIA
jgi:DNA mismatch endonuclease (patch repair protein)